jgi:hypothetical protein
MRCYGLIPIIMTIAVALGMLCGSRAGRASSPSSFRYEASIAARLFISSEADGEIRTWIPLAVFRATVPQAVSTVIDPNGPTLIHLASCKTLSRAQSSWSASEPLATERAYSWPAYTCSTLARAALSAIDLGALNFSNANLASAARAFASAMPFAVSNLYLSNASSEAAASLLWETMDPVVVTPVAIAATATNISDIISQKSHHSPLWPRNRVEAAAFALSIVSGIGGLIAVLCGFVVLREFRKKR